MKKSIKKNILNCLVRILVRIVMNLSIRCSAMFPNYFRAHRKKIDPSYCELDSSGSLSFQEILMNKYIRLKCAFVCLIIFVLYISLNNYFIIFIYLKSDKNQSLILNEKNPVKVSLNFRISLHV